MKIVLLATGKTDSPALQQLIELYAQRLKRYIPFEIIYLPDIKGAGGMDQAKLKEKECAQLQKQLLPGDRLWLLDEKGKQFSSRGFSRHIQKSMNSGPKRLLLVIGGAYGFTDELREKADDLISLSKMTFNHQQVRMIAVEQLYRAFSILKGDPYHND
ncbi:23S rRNA (pseudouridine(1915)-N(3))-methyltransferase RlmH [Robiginitalea sp. IMCC43444]|uniref:23S rRNA (pseudouridine(1915)-N(3))-methyltransferase RlmH n=1 Tax=Robiginitalea sp. IMCC43444 TaxID=3459121 RepID=UPI0040415E83